MSPAVRWLLLFGALVTFIAYYPLTWAGVPFPWVTGAQIVVGFGAMLVAARCLDIGRGRR